MERIQLNDTLMVTVAKLSEGNPGAVTVITQLMTTDALIDPDSAWTNMTSLIALDVHGIYGPRIWVMYKDVCDSNTLRMQTLFRAMQLGLYPEKNLQALIDSRQRYEGYEYLLQCVQDQLPKFGRL